MATPIRRKVKRLINAFVGATNKGVNKITESNSASIRSSKGFPSPELIATNKFITTISTPIIRLNVNTHIVIISIVIAALCRRDPDTITPVLIINNTEAHTVVQFMFKSNPINITFSLNLLINTMGISNATNIAVANTPIFVLSLRTPEPITIEPKVILEKKAIKLKLFPSSFEIVTCNSEPIHFQNACMTSVKWLTSQRIQSATVMKLLQSPTIVSAPPTMPIHTNT